MKKFEPTWSSLSTHTSPQWLQRAKLGIYTHWGPYSVPAYGMNGSWYPQFMYRSGTDAYHHHCRTYGKPEDFGYKDFIPQFKAEKFDADAWAELFKNSGARFGGPVAEHHDGFSMWNSRVNRWNAYAMGPKRDIVGELEKAIRGQGMRFLTTFHHAYQWFFYPTWDQQQDCTNPEFKDLYTGPHGQDTNAFIRYKEEELMANPLFGGNHPDFKNGFLINNTGPDGQHQRPSQWFLDRWQEKLKEVIDRYEPDLLWFDFCLAKIKDSYRRKCAAYYYNKALEWGKEVDILFKEVPDNHHNLPPLTGTLDLEVGNMERLVPHLWVTDTSLDTSGKDPAWSHVTHVGFKTGERLVHNLVDVVSKNGVVLLNVGPRSDGAIPERATQSLKELGRWLEINGEGIYDTVPWVTSGEGPTHNRKSGHFTEASEPRLTATDFRFTTKDRAIYAFCMGIPGDECIIKSLSILYPDEVERVSLLGLDDVSLEWKVDFDGFHIALPEKLPGSHAFTFKIQCY